VTESAHEVGDVLCGRYRLVRHLGSGGMGSVFLAEHTHLRRPTAIKLLHKALAKDPTSEERFRREATMAASIDHSAVAHIYDFDVSEAGEFFLAMEFVEGETLARRLKQDGQFPIALAVKVVVDVGRGIDCAHRLGILHRDIKPDNVMLTASGAVKLLDFGIARPVHPTSPVTSSGVAVGTPAYMSPEQLVADTLTPATDIYSLGLVAWELIAGHVPDAGRNFTELQASRFTKELPSLHRAREDCPESLADVIHRALKIEPEARWPSAAAFADAAEVALRQTTIGAADLTTSGVHTRRLDRLEPSFARLRLAGREREMRLVAEALSVARSGVTAVLTIQADEGAGKSDFLDLARHGAAEHGATLLVGRAQHADVARPYGPWCGIIRRGLELCDDRARWPSLASLVDGGSRPTIPDRVEVFDECLALLRALAKGGLVFVGIDDADICDPASLLLFEFLAGELSGDPVLLAATFGPGHDADSEHARELRQRLRRLRNVTSIELRPIGYEALERWLCDAMGKAPPAALVRYTYGHTEGNAFFIEQVVRSLLEHGELSQLGDEKMDLILETVPAPDAVADVVNRRLKRLSTAANEVIQIAAVIGREFDIDLVLELSNRSEDAVLDAIDEAVAAGVLTSTGDATADQYRFTHVKFGHVHAQSLNTRRRRRLHARIAELLEARPDDSPGAVAVHWYHAGEADRAAQAALRAAEHALAVHDYDDALTHAVMAAETASARQDRCRAHQLRGTALRSLDRYSESAAAFARAQLLEDDNRTRRLLQCEELRSALTAGEVDPHHVADQVQRYLHEASTDEEHTVMALLHADALLAAEDCAASVDAARAACDAAAKIDDTNRLAEGLCLQGAASLKGADFAEARRAIDRARTLFMAIGNKYGLARLALLEAGLEAANGNRRAAEAALAEAAGYGERARMTGLVRAAEGMRESLPQA
jgi:hypothetical protein